MDCMYEEHFSIKPEPEVRYKKLSFIINLGLMFILMMMVGSVNYRINMLNTRTDAVHTRIDNLHKMVYEVIKQEKK